MNSLLPEAAPPRVLRISIAACRMILQWRLGLARCAGSASLAVDRADVKRKTGAPQRKKKIVRSDHGAFAKPRGGIVSMCWKPTANYCSAFRGRNRELSPSAG